MIMKNSTTINLFTSALAALAKSKGYAIVTLFLLAFGSSVSAQNGDYILNNSNFPSNINTVVNKGTNFRITPFSSSSRNSKQQYLYYAGEFNTANNGAPTYSVDQTPKQIKSIAFNVTSLNVPAFGIHTFKNVRIRIGNYTGNDLGSTTSSPFGDQWNTASPVLVGVNQFVMNLSDFTITETGWKEFELIDDVTGQGFIWDGSSNILVEISRSTDDGVLNDNFMQYNRSFPVAGTTWTSTTVRRTAGAFTYNQGTLTSPQPGMSGHSYIGGAGGNIDNNQPFNSTYLDINDRRFRPDVRFKFACANGANINAYAEVTTTVLPTIEGCRRQTIRVTGANRGFGVVFEWQRCTTPDFDPVTIEYLPETTADYVATQMNIPMYYRRITNCGGDKVPSAPALVSAAAINTYTTALGWSSGAPDDFSDSLLDIQDGNPTLTQNAKACGCIVGTDADIVVDENVTLRIGTSLTINGTMTLKNGSSLLQLNPNAANVGNIRVQRTTTPMVVYDYTYYGSPVQDETLGGFSPATLADKYYKWNPAIQNWAPVGPTDVMVPGQGYIIRAPQGWTSTPAAYTGHFVGKPNNGNITTSIMTGATSMNMVVNPYPSPLNLDAFQTENSTKLDGTYYFWTHKTPINATTHQYAANDFALYNSTGGTQAVPGGVVPTGKVAVGQGFMVKGKGATVAADVVQYKNSMRLPATTQAHFYKASGTTSVDVNATEKNRLWLNFSGSTAFKQILVGYVNGATEAYDNGFDGEISADAAVSFYSILGTKQLGIQGKGLPFNVSDVVPIGFKVSSAGTYKIELNNFDGVFAAQNVYLVDKVANITHDLKNGAYEFITTPGTHDERFEITYVSLSLQLGVASNGSTENATDFVAYKQENNLVVNAGSAEIDMVRVYDISGRMLAEKKGLNANDVLISNPNWASQVLIVQMHTVDKVVLTKKVVF